MDIFTLMFKAWLSFGMCSVICRDERLDDDLFSPDLVLHARILYLISPVNFRLVLPDSIESSTCLLFFRAASTVASQNGEQNQSWN